SFIKLVSDELRAFAAQDHERFKAEPLEIADRFFVDSFMLDLTARFVGAHGEMPAIGTAQNSAAARQQPAHIVEAERASMRLCEQSFKSVFNTNDRPAIYFRRCFNYGSNDGVESRRIAAACENCD